MDWYDFKEIMFYAIAVIIIVAILAGAYVGFTWLEIQMARWMGVDPIWIVGNDIRV